jgi:hypothetical protein
LMNIQVLLGLGIRNATLRDQAHSLKLELSCELPPLHDAPPVPSKHLTRCLRNRVQARGARSDGEANFVDRASSAVSHHQERVQMNRALTGDIARRFTSPICPRRYSIYEFPVSWRTCRLP